jgi:hypothetical protein
MTGTAKHHPSLVKKAVVAYQAAEKLFSVGFPFNILCFARSMISICCGLTRYAATFSAACYETGDTDRHVGTGPLRWRNTCLAG